MTTKRKNDVVRERTVLILPRNEFVQRLSERINLGNQILDREINTENGIDQLETDYYNWDELNREILKQSFNNDQNEYYYKYKQLNTMTGFMDSMQGINTNHPVYKIDLEKRKIQYCINELNNLIEKSEFIQEDASIVVAYAREKAEKIFYNKGFIVHGRNDAKKFEVARYIENDLKRKTIILHEQPNRGNTIIEKFESYSKVDFAVAIWTADDVGKGNHEEIYKDRARQNVVFETGFFIGKLERSNVIVLYEDGVEIPSDYQGVIFIPFEGNWKDDLRKEIEAIYEI